MKLRYLKFILCIVTILVNADEGEQIIISDSPGSRKNSPTTPIYISPHSLNTPINSLNRLFGSEPSLQPIPTMPYLPIKPPQLSEEQAHKLTDKSNWIFTTPEDLSVRNQRSLERFSKQKERSNPSLTTSNKEPLQRETPANFIQAYFDKDVPKAEISERDKDTVKEKVTKNLRSPIGRDSPFDINPQNDTVVLKEQFSSLEPIGLNWDSGNMLFPATPRVESSFLQPISRTAAIHGSFPSPHSVLKAPQESSITGFSKEGFNPIQSPIENPLKNMDPIAILGDPTRAELNPIEPKISLSGTSRDSLSLPSSLPSLSGVSASHPIGGLEPVPSILPLAPSPQNLQNTIKNENSPRFPSSSPFRLEPPGRTF